MLAANLQARVARDLRSFARTGQARGPVGFIRLFCVPLARSCPDIPTQLRKLLDVRLRQALCDPNLRQNLPEIGGGV